MSKTLTPLTSVDYKPLHMLLPLRTPLSVTFCSTLRCNFLCEFCYRHNVDKSLLSSESMPLELLEKLAGDIEDFDDSVGVVDICGSGEPLLLPHLTKWIRLLKSTNNIKQLKMITNGTLLTPKKADEVIASGLDLIIVSINGINTEHYNRVVHAQVNFEGLVENIKYLYHNKGRCRLHIKCIGDYFSQSEQERFIDLFSPIADTINIDNMIDQWRNSELPEPPYKEKAALESTGTNNRFGKNFQFTRKPMCNFPFFYMRVHTSGKVSSCATNWTDEMIVGDSKLQSLKEIWHSDALNDLRLRLLREKEADPDCRDCKSYEMMTGEDLTPYRNELLRKYVK